MFHVSTALVLVMVAVLEPLTGGEASPAPEYLWFVLVYAAFFFTPWPVVGYWLASSAVNGLPLLYDSAAVPDNLARELLIVVPMYALVAGIIFAEREVLAGLWRQATALEREQRRLAEEQSSLRRVAMAVAAGSPPEAIFTLVSAEAGHLLGADAAGIGRYLDEARLQVMGVWQGRTEPGQVLELDPADELARVRTEGAPIRIDRYRSDDASRVRALGYRSFVGAPVQAGSTVWGTLVAGAQRPNAFAPGVEERLRDYGELIANAIANAEDRARLGHQAGVDALTELQLPRLPRPPRGRGQSRAPPSPAADYRRRGRRPLPRADRPGRPRGGRAEHRRDRRPAALRRARRGPRRAPGPRRVRDRVRRERPRHGAAGGRARAPAVASAPLRHGLRLTASVGLCDLEAAPSVDELLRRADAAVFWSKEHGRDRSCAYDPAVVRDLASYARRRDLEREQGLAGLHALARAIDAKDPATQEHSERVAALAARLATARGWREECVERLRDAALLHDVGKIGVPDSVLLKPGPLDPREMALMREHAALGARIVGDVLDEMQVSWIAAHHERPDGTGYPNGRSGAEIPEGAALLALADAWDTMVSYRVYSPRRPIADALAECRALTGRQFTAEAVEALEALYVRGDLAMAAVRMHRPTPEPATPRAA